MYFLENKIKYLNNVDIEKEKELLVMFVAFSVLVRLTALAALCVSVILGW